MELSEIAEESARGSFSLMLGTAASMVIGAVTVIVIARLLGPSGYGLYSIALTLPMLFASVADLGVSPSLTRFTASLRSRKEYHRLTRVMRSGLLMTVFTSSLAFFFVVGFAGQLAESVLQRPDIGNLLAVASLMIFSHVLFKVSYNTFVGLDRAGQSALITVLRDLAKLTLSSLLIIAGFGVVGAITGQVFGWGIAGLLGVILMFFSSRALATASSDEGDNEGLQQNVKMMLSYGLPLYVGTLLGSVLTQYQTIVLAFFATNTEIGDFRAALNFGSLITVVATPVATGLFPAFSKLDPQTRREDLRKLFRNSIKYTTLLVSPAAVVIAVLSRDLIRAIYGAAYTSASTYLMLYVGIFLLSGLGSQVIGSFLNGIGRTRETLTMAALQLAVFLPAAPMMTWLFHVRGLIAGLILSSLIAISYGLWLAIRRHAMRIDAKSSLLTLAAAFASALPILPLVQYRLLPSIANIFAGGVIYAAAYLTLAPLLGAVSRADVELLATILGRIRILGRIARPVFAYEGRLLNELGRWNRK